MGLPAGLGPGSCESRNVASNPTARAGLRGPQKARFQSTVSPSVNKPHGAWGHRSEHAQRSLPGSVPPRGQTCPNKQSGLRRAHTRGLLWTPRGGPYPGPGLREGPRAGGPSQRPADREMGWRALAAGALAPRGSEGGLSWALGAGGPAHPCSHWEGLLGHVCAGHTPGLASRRPGGPPPTTRNVYRAPRTISRLQAQVRVPEPGRLSPGPRPLGQASRGCRPNPDLQSRLPAGLGRSREGGGGAADLGAPLPGAGAWRPWAPLVPLQPQPRGGLFSVHDPTPPHPSTEQQTSHPQEPQELAAGVAEGRVGAGRRSPMTRSLPS